MTAPLSFGVACATGVDYIIMTAENENGKGNDRPEDSTGGLSEVNHRMSDIVASGQVRLVRLCVIPLALCIVGDAMAQPAPRMIIYDAPHPLIRLERLNPELHTKYALWARPGSSGERAAVVLSNDSDQPILGISSHWTTVGQDGREQGRWEQCENFLTDKGPVVEAHSTVLLGLSLCVGEQPTRGGIILSQPTSLVNATDVRVLVGGILFANGELFGINASDYAQDLNARAAGATKLAADTRKLLAQGTSRLEAVTAIDQAAHGMPGKEGASYRMYLRSLRMSAEQPQAFDRYLKSLEQYKLPAPIVVKISGVPGMVKTSDAVKHKQ